MRLRVLLFASQCRQHAGLSLAHSADGGHVLRKNLYEGHGRKSEQPVDTTFVGWVTAMIQQSAVVMTCPECEGLSVERPNGGHRRCALRKDDKRPGVMRAPS